MLVLPLRHEHRVADMFSPTDQFVTYNGSLPPQVTPEPLPPRNAPASIGTSSGLQGQYQQVNSSAPTANGHQGQYQQLDTTLHPNLHQLASTAIEAQQVNANAAQHSQQHGPLTGSHMPPSTVADDTGADHGVRPPPLIPYFNAQAPVPGLQQENGQLYQPQGPIAQDANIDPSLDNDADGLTRAQVDADEDKSYKGARPADDTEAKVAQLLR